MNNVEKNEKQRKILTLTDIVGNNASIDKDGNHIINQFWADETNGPLPQIILTDSTRVQISNEEQIKKGEEAKLISNPSYYNGRNLRLEGIEMQNGKPVLIASEIDYLTNRILGTKQSVSQILKNIGPEGLSGGIGLSAIIVTSDGKYLFGEKSDKNSQVVHDFVGGVLEVPKNFQYQKYKNLKNPSDVKWLEYTLAREICEEIGIKFHRIDLENAKYLGMIGGGFGRFNIPVIVPVYLSFDEIQTRFGQMQSQVKQSQIPTELSGILGLKKDEYIDFLSGLTKPKQLIAQKLKNL